MTSHENKATSNFSPNQVESPHKEFKRKLLARGYPDNLSKNILSEVKFNKDRRRYKLK